MTGLTLYHGPSVLDPDKRIVCIVTFRSSNRKTGDIPQTWIMDASMTPVEAVKTGADASVCGSCPHRPSTGGACYVNTGQAPLGVYRKWKEGGYPMALPSDMGRFDGETVRLGAYGDPAAVPYEIWEPLVTLAKTTLGYTHQVMHPRFDTRILRHCMVSADSPGDAQVYRDAGLRTFRVKRPEDTPLPFEVECVADATPGKTCKDCGLCNGAAQRGGSIYINVHGPRKNRFIPHETYTT